MTICRMMGHKILLLISLFLMNCQEPYEQRLHKESVKFCIKLEKCTTAKYDVCMQSIANNKKGQTEDELTKLEEFTKSSTCDELFRLINYYQR